MKTLISIAIIAFTFLSFSNDKEKMEWNENKKLTWADFKGNPSGSAIYAASTNSGISFSFASKTRDGKTTLDYTVQTNFYPKLSWYRKDVVSPYILAHEQTHFDISELYARMLRKKLKEVNLSANGKKMQIQIERIYNTNEKERQETQFKFDRETEHSRNQEMEATWETHVAQQLQKYDDWK